MPEPGGVGSNVVTCVDSMDDKDTMMIVGWCDGDDSDEDDV